LNLPDGSGLSLVSEVARDYPNMPIAVITAYGSMDVAIDALKKVHLICQQTSGIGAVACVGRTGIAS